MLGSYTDTTLRPFLAKMMTCQLPTALILLHISLGFGRAVLVPNTVAATNTKVPDIAKGETYCHTILPAVSPTIELIYSWCCVKMSDEEKIKTLIPAEFHMISGSHDVQTSADVFNVNKVRPIAFSMC